MIERIGLVLCHVDALLQQKTSRRVLRNTRIVARRHILRAELARPLQQPLEFHIAVAGDAGIRRAPARILIKEIVDNFLLKQLAEVHGIVRNADNLAHTARIVHAAQAAAATVAVLRLAALLRETHRHADDLIALLHQQRRRQRTIHAPRHRANHRFLAHISTQPHFLTSLLL